MKKGKYIPSRELVLKFIPNNLQVSRFGIVVSTKVSKSAVQRNTLKRRIREILRLNLGMIAPGFDVAILTNQQALKLEYASLSALLMSLLKRGSLIKITNHAP